MTSNNRLTTASLYLNIKIINWIKLIYVPDVKLPEEESRSDDGSRDVASVESSEEILAKYRRKSSVESTGNKHKRSQRRVSDVPDIADVDRYCSRL